MNIYKLSKTAIMFRNNPAKLLNGITTNSLDSPRNAFVDMAGRIVATFEQINLNPDEVLILVENSAVDNMKKHLEKYLLLSKTKMEIADFNVYFDLDSSYNISDGEFSVQLRKGKLIVTKKSPEPSVSYEEFALFRVENNIPLQGIDYNNEMLLNVSDEFVSFTKGCFLGQEILARVHNLGKPPKKLAVMYADECNEDELKRMTSRIVEKKTGRLKGFVFVENKKLFEENRNGVYAVCKKD